MSGPTVNGRGGRDDADRRFGTLKSVCVRRIGTRKYLQLVGQPHVKRPLSTLVLRSQCSHALSELEETCRGIVRAVPRLFREPFILPGAGEAELLAANALRGTRPLSVGAGALPPSKSRRVGGRGPMSPTDIIV